MKTTFYVTFGLTNTVTKNFLVGTFTTDDEALIKLFKDEQRNSSAPSTLKQYIFDHPECYSEVQSFVTTLDYFAQDVFSANLLGVYIEKSDAEQRMNISLEGFKRSKGNTRYFNDCYNLNPHIENEEEEQAKIKNCRASLKPEPDSTVNAKSEVKKQSITIVERESGEEHKFETKGDCMKWLDCASDTFSRFLKGGTKLIKKYFVKEE